MAETGTDRPLGWERLVTDGHVRAARMRRVVPALLVLGLLLALLGRALLASAYRTEPVIDPATIVLERVEALQQSAMQPLAALSTAIRLEPEEIDATPPAEEVPELVEVVLSGLQVDDRIPTSVLVEEVDPLAFFSASWPVGRLVSVRDEDLVAIGGVVHETRRPGQLVPRRWVGVFRRAEGAWKAYTLEAPGLLQPEGAVLVTPSAIPVSLNRLMGREPV